MTAHDFLRLQDFKKRPHFNFSASYNAKFGYNDKNTPNDSITFQYPDISLLCEYYCEERFCNLSSSSNKLLALNLNIQSLPAKFEKLLDFIDFFDRKNVKFDIICLQEIWQIKKSELFNIPGYHPLIYKCRRNEVQGGGVGIYIRDNLSYNLREDLSIFYDKILESLVVDICLPSKEIITSSIIYRSNGQHPTLSYSQQCNEFISLYDNLTSQLAQLRNKSLIFTDSNINILDLNNDLVNEFLNINSTNGFIDFINYPTRLNGNNATLIDQIFSNIDSNSINSGILISDLSDHLPSFILINGSNVKAKLSKETT